MRIIPGVMNAAKTFQRGHAPLKRAKRMPRRAEALGDVAGDVDADHVERHALGAGAPQGREAVADLLEADAEAAPETSMS